MKQPRKKVAETIYTPTFYSSRGKRICDLAIVGLLMPGAAVLTGLCGILIKLDDGGPVFYEADRLGRDGSLFRMYKLRTMRANAPDIRNSDGSTLSSSRDPRLTRCGRWLRASSLDELPQLVNVLKGDMSIVGPRPDLPEQLLLYAPETHGKLLVRPGITGYNQAYFRNSIPWAQRLQNDLYYVANISLGLDIAILAKTAIYAFSKKGRSIVHQDGSDNA